MAIKIEPRVKKAPEVQEVLTKYGCIIHTRIGLHEATHDKCANSGLVLLNLLSDEKEEIKNLQKELDNMNGVSAKVLEM
jgi:hypothetical protein